MPAAPVVGVSTVGLYQGGLMRAAVQACTQRSSSHQTNEDRATVGEEVLTSTAGVERVSVDAPSIVAVLDGVGGAPCADMASDLAARAISAAVPPRDEEAVRAILGRADRLLLDAGALNVRRAGMATTASVLVLTDDGWPAMVANVGDSLVAHLGDAGLREISVSDRLGRGNIYQALGGFDDPTMTPHVTDLELAAGDRLLLATDGLTDAVGVDAIEGVLREQGDDAVERLLQMVEQAGKPDDVTIVVVDIESV
jgi:PPM family protein phosphatase